MDKNKHAIEIYNKIAEEYSARCDDKESDEDLVLLKPFLATLKPDSYVVDLGCGTGFSAVWFVRNGMRAEGSDLSEEMIKIARRNYPDIKFSVADMRTFKSAEMADAVWAGYSLFHFEQSELEKTLDQIKTYLKPNGILGIVLQEGDGEFEMDEPLLAGEKIYLHLYTEEQIKEILKNHGFEIIDVRRKKPLYPIEFKFNKILLIAKLI